MPQPLYPRERDPLILVKEAELTSGPVLMVVEKSQLPLAFNPWAVQPIAS